MQGLEAALWFKLLVVMSLTLKPHLTNGTLFGILQVWDLISGRLIQTQVYPVGLTAILLDPEELLMFVGSVDGRIFVNRLEFGIVLEDPIIVAEDRMSGMLKGHK